MRRSPTTLPVTHPEYPHHGTMTGYDAGCRPTRGVTCPATEHTCYDAYTIKRLAADDRRRNRLEANRPKGYHDLPMVAHVRRRLDETIAAVGLETLLAYRGVTSDQINAIRAETSARVPAEVAEPADRAWAHLTRGSNTYRKGFPHGTVTGYNSGYCRCVRCRDAHGRIQARRRVGITTPATAVKVAGLAAHVARLIAAAGSISAVAEQVGLSHVAVQRASEGGSVRARTAQKLAATDPAALRAKGTLGGTITVTPGLADHTAALVDAADGVVARVAETAGIAEGAVRTALAGRPTRTNVARALLSVRPETVRAARRRVYTAPVRRVVGSLNALGYPDAWIVRQHPHLHRSSLQGLHRNRYIDAATAAAVDEVAARVGDRAATTADGLLGTVITRTRNEARAAGHYPPAAYDENGVLDPRAAADNPFAEADAMAGRIIEALYEGTRLVPASFREVTQKWGFNEHTYRRYRTQLGIRMERDSLTGEYFVHPDSKAIAAKITEVCHAYRAGEVGPVESLLLLGLNPPQWVPADHPDLLAVAADEADAEAVA